MDSKIIFLVGLLPTILWGAIQPDRENLPITSVKVICFDGDEKSLPSFCDQTISLKSLSPLISSEVTEQYDHIIFAMQSYLRKRIDTYPNEMFILYAEGSYASLLAIAQTNLLPYYRKYIAGMILKNLYADWMRECHFPKEDSLLSECQSILTLTKQLHGRASLRETATALSPARQVDWYWSPTLLLWDDYKPTTNQQQLMETALEDNGIHYDSLPSHNTKRIQQFIHRLKQDRGYILYQKEPSYHAPTLRFHLAKILYQPKHHIIHQIDSYGKDPSQQYDIYYRSNSIHHPIFIYIHGGGWSHGDKKSFQALCQQYADKGFSAISINYRLLNLPKIDMSILVQDITTAIRTILKRAKKFHGDPKRVVIMAESAGAQLAFMALTSLSKREQKQIKLAIFNSMPANLHLYPKTKQIRLSGIQDDKIRKRWLKKFSPLYHLHQISIPLLCIHSLDDRVVCPEHLQHLISKAKELHYPLKTLWVSHASHPITPTERTLQPSYHDLENRIDNLIYFRLKK